MVRPAGFEPATFWFEARHSNPLSYGRIPYTILTEMTIRNLQEAEAALLPYVPLVKQLEGKDVTLRRVWPLMELLGNPQEKLKIIHVAGTSGKTSTAYYLSALLTAAGCKTGLTVSPHVDSLTERVQVAGRPLSEKQFCEELSEFLGIIRTAGQKPSYFELLYAFALWVFERRGVDYAVVETGMGGLHDATNVARRADKVCIITDIGFDHTHILGSTLAEIAAQKAGIIHPGNRVFIYQQIPEVMAAVNKRLKEKNARLHIVEEGADDRKGIPAYQQRNWHLAYAAYGYLAKRDGLGPIAAGKLSKTRLTRVPARMDIVQASGKSLVMDGAHNAQKMAAFIESFQKLYPDTRPAVLIALKEGKEYQQLVPLLAPFAARIITTTFHTSQDLPAVSQDSGELAEAFRGAGATAEAIPEQALAFRALLKTPEEVCVVTGSFYLLSQIRNNEKLI